MRTQRIAGWGLTTIVLGAAVTWAALNWPRSVAPAGSIDSARTPTFFPTMRPVGGYPFPDPKTYLDPTSDPKVVAAAETDVALILTQQTTYVIEGEATPWIATEVPPLDREALVVDKLNSLALTVPQGWYVFVPPSDATGGLTVLMNFKTDKPNEFPPDGIKIQIGSSAIPEDRKAGDFALEQFRASTSIENGFPVATLSPMENMLVGDQPTFAVAVTVEDPRQNELLLAIPDGNRMLFASIKVGESRKYSDYTDALKLLSTLDVSP